MMILKEAYSRCLGNLSELNINNNNEGKSFSIFIYLHMTNFIFQILPNISSINLVSQLSINNFINKKKDTLLNIKKGKVYKQLLIFLKHTIQTSVNSIYLRSSFTAYLAVQANRR